MKFNKKLFLVLIIIWIILYIYSLYTILNWISKWLYIFWWNEVILYSLLHFVISFIIIYTISIFLYNKWLFKKILLLILFLFISTNFWYTYNSFPNIQNIDIINNVWEDIIIRISPIYKFDKEVLSNIDKNNKIKIELLWGGEYWILKNKKFEVKAFLNNKEIYFNTFETNYFLRWDELEPKIIIE